MSLLQSQAKDSGFEIILLDHYKMGKRGDIYYYAIQKEERLKSYLNFDLENNRENMEIRITIDCPDAKDAELITAECRAAFDESFSLDKYGCFAIKDEESKISLIVLFTILFDYLKEKYSPEKNPETSDS